MATRSRQKALVWIVRPGARGPEVLLLERPQARGGGLHPVTGKAHRGETAAAAAAREALEETGLAGAVHDLGHLHQFQTEKPGKPATRWQEHAFLIVAPRGAEPVLSAEHVAARWVPAADADALLQWAAHRETLRLATDAALEAFR